MKGGKLRLQVLLDSVGVSLVSQKDEEIKRMQTNKDNADIGRAWVTLQCLYLQVVQALLESAHKVGNLLILQSQRVGDLTKRFLKKDTKSKIQLVFNFFSSLTRSDPFRLMSHSP